MRRSNISSLSKRSILVIKFIEDKRYTDRDDIVITHAQQSFEEIEGTEKVSTLIIMSTLTLADAEKKFDRQMWELFDVICVDEGQFFSDLLEFCDKWADNGIEVHVCGINNNLAREPLGRMCDLVSRCDSIVQLKGVCRDCKAPAKFNMRDPSENVNVKGADDFKPVCRRCYKLTKF